LWNNPTRQFFINNISNREFILDCLYDHLFHYQDFDYDQFLEKNCPKEIEKNIYAMLHDQGGLLFIGYHPENLTESIMSDIELIITIYLMQIFLRTNICIKILIYKYLFQ